MNRPHPLAPVAESEAARRLLLAASLPRPALNALDQVSRPMTPREIERSLAGIVTRSQRLAIVTALRNVAIIMIAPENRP